MLSVHIVVLILLCLFAHFSFVVLDCKLTNFTIDDFVFVSFRFFSFLSLPVPDYEFKMTITTGLILLNVDWMFLYKIVCGSEIPDLFISALKKVKNGHHDKHKCLKGHWRNSKISSQKHKHVWTPNIDMTI